MSEAKRKEFRAYLDDKGASDSINRVLMSLYEEPVLPEDPMDYIKQYLGNPKGVDSGAIKSQNQSLKQEIATLEAQIAAIKQRL